MLSDSCGRAKGTVSRFATVRRTSGNGLRAKKSSHDPPRGRGDCMEANVALNVFGGVRDYVPSRAITRDSDDVRSAVVIVDGDVSARESLERLIRTAGWEP